MISTFMPLAAGLKSSTASFADATEPGPLSSENRLDISVNTPILTTPSVYWADAAAISDGLS
jgi:hypothetical protein